MKRPLVLALAAGAALLAAGAAHASDVHWSVGIGLPPVATVISNGPVYGPAPVYVPAPIYGAAPVYAPPVVDVAPVYVPPPVVVAPPVVYRGWHRPRYVVQRPVVASREVGWQGGWDHDGRGHDQDQRRHRW
jgi:hypothetical protein